MMDMMDVDSCIPGMPPYLLAGTSTIRAEVARVFELGYRGQPVGAYTGLEARFGWRIAPGVEVSVIGTKLNGGHAEYGSPPVRGEVPRAVGVKVVWQR